MNVCCMCVCVVVLSPSLAIVVAAIIAYHLFLKMTSLLSAYILTHAHAHIHMHLYVCVSICLSRAYTHTLACVKPSSKVNCCALSRLPLSLPSLLLSIGRFFVVYLKAAAPKTIETSPSQFIFSVRSKRFCFRRHRRRRLRVRLRRCCICF